jgi:hypothetical protein
MKVQFALCAQTASIDRTTNRVSIFNVIDHLPVSSFPINVPAVTFVSVIESDKDGDSNVKGILEITANKSLVARVDVPINFTTNRLARVVINFQGIPVREAGPLTFRLTIPTEVTAETTFQVTNVSQKEAIQVATPSTAQQGK